MIRAERSRRGRPSAVSADLRAGDAPQFSRGRPARAPCRGVWTLAVPHVAFVVWMLYCDRAMRKQRATELARYRALEDRRAAKALATRPLAFGSREWPPRLRLAGTAARSARRARLALSRSPAASYSAVNSQQPPPSGSATATREPKASGLSRRAKRRRPVRRAPKAQRPFPASVSEPAYCCASASAISSARCVPCHEFVGSNGFVQRVRAGAAAAAVDRDRRNAHVHRDVRVGRSFVERDRQARAPWSPTRRRPRSAASPACGRRRDRRRASCRRSAACFPTACSRPPRRRRSPCGTSRRGTSAPRDRPSACRLPPTPRYGIALTDVPPPMRPTLNVVFGSRGTSKSAMFAIARPSA